MSTKSSPIYAFKLPRLQGGTIDLSEYEGQVLLLVNTASRCGFTPQYAGLEKLHRTYQARGLTVIGFPCNQFGQQEPGGPGAIQEFCEMNYGVSFALSEKIEVNGPNAHPLFQFLTATRPGVLGSRAIKWNFTKFLVDREGNVLKRFAPATKPESLVSEIERLL